MKIAGIKLNDGSVLNYLDIIEDISISEWIRVLRTSTEFVEPFQITIPSILPSAIPGGENTPQSPVQIISKELSITLAEPSTEINANIIGAYPVSCPSQEITFYGYSTTYNNEWTQESYRDYLGNNKGFIRASSLLIEDTAVSYFNRGLGFGGQTDWYDFIYENDVSFDGVHSQHGYAFLVRTAIPIQYKIDTNSRIEPIEFQNSTFFTLNSGENLVAGKTYYVVTTQGQLNWVIDKINTGGLTDVLDVVVLTGSYSFYYQDGNRYYIIQNGGARPYSKTINYFFQYNSALWNSSTDNVPPEPPKERGGPVIGPSNTGMVALYATPANVESGDNEVQKMAKQMWTKELVESLKQSLFNTSDAIINLSLLPFNLKNMDATGGTDKVIPAEQNPEDVVLNGVTIGLGTNKVEMYNLQHDFGYIDMGIASVTAGDEDYMTKSPFVRFRLYLPFSGYHEISPDDFLNKYIHIICIVDLFTGNMVYEVYRQDATDSPESSWTLMYTFTGNCQYNIPVTSGDFGNMWTRYLQVIGGVMK